MTKHGETGTGMSHSGEIAVGDDYDGKVNFGLT